MGKGKAGFRSSVNAFFSPKQVNSWMSDHPLDPPAQSPICPECGSAKAWKDGFRHTDQGLVQRWLCRSCGKRFSQSSLTNKKEDQHTLMYQVCVADGATKNLDIVENRTEVGLRETTETTATIKGKILEFAWYMQKQGYSSSTIKSYPARIKRIANLGADIFNSESVKEVLASQTWGDGYKNAIVIAYTAFLLMLGQTWNPPHYKVPESIPFIPLESELDCLINSCGRKIACYLQGLKDTGADPGELARLEWSDINFEAKSISLKHPVKGHHPRILSVSDAFLGRLGSIQRRNDKIFATIKGIQTNYAVQRRRYANILGNPRINKIELRTFRHWKGTTEYHKTKDIIHVQKILGHKSIQSTMIYINLESALFQAKADEFHVRVAENINEVCDLIKVGFDYIGNLHGKEVFRKRK